MIPPQLALFIAQHGKKLLWVGLFVVAVLAVRMALAYHERVVQQNAELKSQLASVELARQVDSARARSQADAIQKWQAAHAQLERRLAEMQEAQATARDEKEKLNAFYRDNDLSQLATADRASLELRINHDADRMRRLLVCASAGRDCSAGPDGASALGDAATVAGTVGIARSQMDRLRTGLLSRP